MLGRGRRLFSVAAILLIVVAGLRTVGHFSPPLATPVLVWLFFVLVLFLAQPRLGSGEAR